MHSARFPTPAKCYWHALPIVTVTFVSIAVYRFAAKKRIRQPARLLIGIELMKTVMMYLDEHVIQVEFVLTVAIIAIAWHAIDINYPETSPLSIIATGVVVLSLTFGYYFFKKAGTS